VAPTLAWDQLAALGLGDGPAARDVRVRVEDGHGHAVTSAPTTLEVANVAPTAALNSDGPVLDGDPATVRFVGASDPSAADTASLRYAFALDPNDLIGVTYADAGTEPTATFTFAAAGSYTVYGLVIDKDGGSRPYSTVVTVDHLAPAVVATTYNDGALQRSNLETIRPRFNRGTSIPDLIGAGAIAEAVRLFRGGTRVDLPAGHFLYDPASFTPTIDLTTDGFGGSRLTTLTDGRYELRLATAEITAPGSSGTPLTDDDGLADGWLRREFHRLEGDYNGNAVVDLADRADLLAHFGTRVGQSADDFLYDLSGDGLINLVDYLLWSRKLNRKV
jgi:hypothetical protein